MQHLTRYPDVIVLSTHGGRMGGNQLVPLAVQAMIITLQQYGVPFAFTGNIACNLYGEGLHPPEKIEILLLSRKIIISELKRMLAHNHPTHFVCHPHTYQFLYRNMPLTAQNISPSAIEITFTFSDIGRGSFLCTVDGIPLVPYSVLLLQLLHVWDGTSPTLGNIKSAHEADILRMLKVFRRREDFQHHPAFDEALQAVSEERVARFFAAHPSYRKEWQRMGLMPHRVREVEGQVESIGLTQANGRTADTLPPSTDDTIALVKVEKLTRMQIRRLACRTAVDILQAHGFPSAIFGSMACKLYGNRRIPNDVDILVLPPPMHTLQGLPPTQESLKDLLVASAPSHFVLKPARDPDATYRVLWFLPTPTTKPTPHKATKVDVLLPGVMHLPDLPAARVFWRGGGLDAQLLLPVLPFAVLLLQKLQGWDDHRKAEEERYRAKVEVDVADLEWMLGLGVGRFMEGWKKGGRGGVGGWNDRVVCSEEFEVLSRERVRAFCEAYPRWTSVWKGLGFEVP